MINQYLNFYL